MLPRSVALGLVWLASLTALPGAEPGTRAPQSMLKTSTMDYGSVLTYTVGLPEIGAAGNTNLALKGLCIRVGDAGGATLCFDTDLLRYYAGWSRGWLDISKTHLTSSKGSYHALIQGTVHFQSQLGPGWAGRDGFSDPRPIAAGPLPRAWGRYQGFYRHGERVVLRYQIGAAQVLELPGAIQTNDITVFSRTLLVEHAQEPLQLKVCDLIAPARSTSVQRSEDGH